MSANDGHAAITRPAGVGWATATLGGQADQPHRRAARELPQALTHLALISAAFNLDRALGA
jgi:hypothetical protein